LNRPNEYLFSQFALRQLILNFLRVSACFSIVLVISGCVSQKTMRRDITSHLRKTAILLPYVAEKTYDAHPDFVFEMLINKLEDQGGRILSWDRSSAVVSWYDTGGAFVPLPGVAKETKTYQMINGKVTFWHGYVYGCARIVNSEKGAWLAIRTIGRDVTSGQRVFSDGSYERKLFSSLSRAIHRIATGQNMAPDFRTPKLNRSGRTGANYEELFKSGFKYFPKIDCNEITAGNKGERYPVAVARLWKASLDVITQYALVPYVESDSKTIVFSRRFPVPMSVQSTVVKPVDVIMAVTVQPDVEEGEDSSRIYVSMLGQNDMKSTLIEKISAENQSETEIDLNRPLVEIAATMAENELIRQIDAQLFYNENLGNKLLRRLK